MKKRNAFSMIELLIVMVVIGILATYSIPRLQRDIRSEAINHILGMIRYTQNLALHDKKHSDTNTTWQRSFWRFEIQKCNNSNDLFYKIGTDINFNKGISRAESAIDPSNSKYIFWDSRKDCPKNSKDALMEQVSPNIFLTQKYGINGVTFSCQINNNHQVNTYPYISFDNFGRPIKSWSSYTPNYWGYVVSDCTITFTFKDTSINPFTIIVPKESGYAYLQENINL